jgi:hypothetical protein
MTLNRQLGDKNTEINNLNKKVEELEKDIESIKESKKHDLFIKSQFPTFILNSLAQENCPFFKSERITKERSFHLQINDYLGNHCQQSRC